MAIHTASDEALFSAGAGLGQWTLTKMQMVNWGCYQGHVKVDIPPGQTIITGASGSGKSTLLDVHTALLYRTRARFNTASNRAERGRARGEGERNITKYMRGRVAGTRDRDGRATDRILREGTVWSALAETYIRRGGHTITLWAAFYLRPDESKPSVSRWAYRPSDFDISALAAFTGPDHSSRPLPKRAIADAFPGTEFCDGPTDFRSTAYDELGLTEQAARLLEDIQSSAGVESVTDLFRMLVLDQPGTYQAADTALEHFTSCAQAYQNLRDHEQQIEMLRPIRGWHEEMLRARNDAAFLSPLGATPNPSDSPFWHWVRDTESRLLEQSVETNRGRRHAAASAESDDAARVVSAKAALEAALRRVAAAGGDRLLLLEQQISEADAAAARAEQTRERYVVDLDGFLPVPTSAAEHSAHQVESRRWLAEFTDRDQGIQARRDSLAYRLGKAEDEAKELRAEAAYRVSRKDLIPERMDVDRREFAAAVGLDPERLPFLAELVDMDPQWEPWRMAVEKALGALAFQILVPARSANMYRQRVDPIPTTTRYQWVTVPDDEPLPATLDPATAAGRLQFKARHPYRAWLSCYLADRLNHVCVESGAELNTLPSRVRGLSLQGQVRDGRRGAHGGQSNHRHVIGFSPKTRLNEIVARLEALKLQIEEIKGVQKDAGDEQDRHHRERSARQRVVVSAWDEMDVSARRDDLGRLEDEKRRLRDDNAALDAAEQASEQAHGNYKDAIQALSLATSEVTNAQDEHRKLCERQDMVSSHQDRMLNADVAIPDLDRLTSRFTEWHGGPPTLDVLTHYHLSKFSSMLTGAAGQAKQTADTRHKGLAERFAAYNQKWEDPNRGIDPDVSFDEFNTILTERLAAGLDALRDKFVEWTSTVTGLELVKMKQQFDAAPKAIADRLHAINAVLEQINYSSRNGRISIASHPRRTPEVQNFAATLIALAEESTTDLTFDTAVTRFQRLQALMDQIDADKATDKGSRDRILDVRRHLSVEAEHHLDDGTLFATYDTLGDQSGGEMQELAMFILGAALRYQLGDIDTPYPRFAPVFMDEGMVKADPEHTDRALRVWSALGFQPLVALPVDKFESAQQGCPAPTLQISRDDRGISRIDLLTPRP